MQQDSLDWEFIAGGGYAAMVVVGVCLYVAPVPFIVLDLIAGVLIAATIRTRKPEALSISSRPAPKRQGRLKKAA